MSNIKIQGEVSLDTSNADAALTRVTTGASKMSAAVGKSGKEAADSIGKIGDGGAASAAKVEASTRNMIGAIQRTTAALEAGSKSGAEYYESLAKQRGVDVSVLRPYLAQLDAVKIKQEEAAISAASMQSAYKAIGIGIGAGIVGFAAMINKTIDAADSMNDLSKTTGIAVEQLAGLKLAAQQSGGDLDGIAKSINKLSMNIGKDGEKFKQLGIDAKDPLEAFKQLSDIFKSIEDPQTRAALGAAALGKSWESAAPLLSEGSKSIGEMVTKGSELSGITKQLALDSDAFNDAIAEVSTGISGKFAGATAALLPLMNELAKSLSDTASEASASPSSFSPLTETFRALILLGGNVAFTFKAVGTEIGGIAAQAAALASGDWRGALAIGDMMKADAENARKSFDEWEQRIVKVGTVAEQTGKKIVASMSVREFDNQMAAKALNESRVKSLLDDEDDKKKNSAAKSAEKARESFIKSLEKEAATYGMTATQSKLYEASLLGIKGKQLDRVKSTLSVFDAEKKAAEAVKASAAEYKKYIDNLDSGNEKLAAQVKAQEEYNARIGLGKDELAALDAAEMEHQAVTAESIAMTMDMMDWSGKLGDAYRKQAEELRNLAALKITGASKQIGFDISKKAQDDLNKFLDPKKAQTFGEALKGAFGGAGDALGKLTSSLQAYSIKEAEIAQAKKDFANDTTSSDSERAEKAIQLAEKETAYRIGSYGDIADAASGFFDKQSKGYELLQGASKAFHAAEIALQLASIAPKLAAGAATMFGQSGWGGFAGVAAMGAVMAGFGISSRGGSGSAGISSGDAQKTQGTGAAFGDASQKSDSISKAIELTARNSAIELSHTSGMLSALKNIEASMGGLANIVFRTNGITDGSNFNVSTGKFDSSGSALSRKGLSILPQDSFTKKLNDATGKFLFGSSSTSITDGGLQYGGSLSALQSGLGINQYANINTTKKGALGGIFGGNSSVNTTQTQAVSKELSQQFAQIFIGVQDALTSAAVGMGLGADKVSGVLNGLTVATTNLSLKGLSGQALTDAINAVISKSLDEISSAAFPELASFRKVGEGYAETVVRISANYQNLDSILQSISGTFGAVGLSSIAARERLIDLAGGVDNLAQQTSSFAENYLTEAERLAPVSKYVAEQLAALGKSGLTTRDQFKEAVLGLANSGALATEAGAATYAGLLNIADAFAKVTPAVDGAAIAAQALADAAQRMQAIASERTGLENELLQMQGNTQAIRQRELALLDESNRALKQSIYDLQDKQAADAIAATEAQKAADAASQAASQAQQASEQIRSAWQSITNTLFDEVARIRGLTAGNSAQSLASAQAQFSIANVQALSGDQEAAKLLPKLSQTLLAIAEQQSPTLEALNRIRASTAGSLENTANSFSRFGATAPAQQATQAAPATYQAQAIYQPINLPQVSTAAANDTLVSSLIVEVREMKATVEKLVSPAIETERNTRKMKDNIQRVTHDGEEMQTRVLA